MKGIYGLAIKVFISLLLLFYLFLFSGKVNIHEIIRIIEGTRPSLLLLAFLILFGNVFLSTKRWALLLPVKIRYTRLVSLYLIGYFFNTFLPGRVGGDIIKTFYLYRDIQKGGISIASVFMDRYTAISGVVLLSLIAFTGGYSYFRDTPMEWFIPLMSAGFAVASLVFWGVNWGRIGWLRELYGYIRRYKGMRNTVLGCVALTLVTQSVFIMAVYLISIAMGLDVPVIYFFVFVPIINAVTAIPITIGGLGLREAGFAVLFEMFFSDIGATPDQAVTLSLLLFVIIIMVNMVGGIEYIRLKAMEVQPP